MIGGDIQNVKQHLSHNFQTKDLSPLKYFFGIVVAHSNIIGVAVTWFKYALDIFEEMGMANCYPSDTPLDSSIKQLQDVLKIQVRPNSTPKASSGIMIV